MNKLKKIYYPILAAVFVIALVLGFVSGQVNLGVKADQDFADKVRAHMQFMDNVHNSYESENLNAVRSYIADMLDDNGVFLVGGAADSDYEDVTFAFNAEDESQPSFIAQRATLGLETFEAMHSDDDTLFYAAKELYNIVAVIPGKSEDAVLFTANYDSAAKSQSGIESMQAVAMLQTIIDTVKDFNKGNRPDNTLVFVFTDAEHEGAYGAYAFRYQFKGFDGIAEKVKLAINFGAIGTGALAVTAEGISVSGVKGLASGLIDAIDGINGVASDYDVYDVAKINIFFSGSRDYLNTARDTVKNVTDGQIKTMGGVMSSLVSAYGFGKINEAASDGAFSYMGLTLSYSSVVSYILGAIALVLLIVAVFAIIRSGKKVDGLIRGVFAQIAAIVLTAVILYACYFLLALLLAGFGVVPINALTTIRYMNVGLLISCLLLAFAAYAGVFLVLRRFYKVKATDAARGGAILIMIVGIAMAFAMPAGSFIFALTAALEGIALIVAAMLSKKFHSKYEADIERLFIYTLPLILLTPAMIPLLLLAGYSLNAVYLPLILSVAVVGFGVIAPYFGMLKPALSNAVSKLPKHTIRVEKVVTEQVEGAKKGRFHEVTTKKVVSEKIEWKYRNRYGIAVLGVLSAILIILFAVCPAYNFSTNIVDTFSYREAVKDDSIVYVWEQTNNLTNERIRIYDQVAYSFFGTVDNGFEWNSSVGAFEKNFTDNTQDLLDANSPVRINLSTDTLDFIPYDSATESIIDITFKKVSKVTKFTIIINDRDDIEIENDGKDTFKIEIPYNSDDFASFSVQMEYEGSLVIGVDYCQYTSGERTNQKMNNAQSDYGEIVSILRGAGVNYIDNITCGMIFYKSDSYTLS